MGAKATRHPAGAPALGPLLWEPPAPRIPGLDVHELTGEEADAQWAAAWLNLYLDPEERAFAGTAPAPLS